MDVEPIERDAALAGLQVAVQHIQQGAFAGAAAPHECNEATAFFADGKRMQADMSVGKAKANLRSLKVDGVWLARCEEQVGNVGEVHRRREGAAQHTAGREERHTVGHERLTIERDVAIADVAQHVQIRFFQLQHGHIADKARHLQVHATGRGNATADDAQVAQ
ncbi:MAG: hypothetical protein DDT34_02487 [Firmicutes bacterium]|nr:hypothetical protein [Bacillota bacterium]